MFQQQLVTSDPLVRRLSHRSGFAVEMKAQWQADEVIEEQLADTAAHALFRLPMNERT